MPVPAGFYLLTLGQLVVSDDVSIAGAGQTNTIIDGNATDRVFDIEVSTEISGVTIQNGYSPHGGGISSGYGLTLTNSTVSGNYAEVRGGGIESVRGTLTITDSTVSGNYAGGGGGINNSWGDLTLTNSTVSGNTATSGGGISSGYGRLTLTNSTVSGNTATSGGGIDSVVGILNITDSTVSGNTATSGGGIDSWGSYTFIFDTITITNSTVSGNTGGGIDTLRSSLTITNSTVSGNTGGAAIFIHYGNTATNLTNSTVSGNNGGLAAIDSNWSPVLPPNPNAPPPTLTNTIVADNGPANCSGRVRSLGYNLTDDTSCAFRVVADAMLGPLQDNGGPTETHDLLDGSPAIDAGSMDCPPPDTDQRGMARPHGAGCDIGSVESLSAPPAPHAYANRTPPRAYAHRDTHRDTHGDADTRSTDQSPASVRQRDEQERREGQQGAAHGERALPEELSEGKARRADVR